jgi:pimeloyl-ACP methyl ester carboxylesterase
MPDPDAYLQVEGATLRYRDSGTGPVVVLMHGWTLDLQMWEPQVERLAGCRRLVRFDRRGHGLSGGSPAPGQDVADLAALCRHLGLDNIVLVGMSQGARSALGFAAAAPAMVRALVLDGAPDLDPAAPPSDIPLEYLRGVLQTQGLDAFRSQWRQHPHMRLHTTDPAMRRLLDGMLARYAGLDLREAATAERALPARVPLADISAPTLVLNGALDLVSRSAAADYLCSQLPRAQRLLIDAAGHLPNLDRPQDYAEALGRASRI